MNWFWLYVGFGILGVVVIFFIGFVIGYYVMKVGVSEFFVMVFISFVNVLFMILFMILFMGKVDEFKYK